MSFIQTKALKVAYGDTVVINNEQVTIDRGSITVIIGSNGCGKSTMLKAIARVIPFEGNVMIKDEDINIYSRKSLARILSMLPQKPEGTAGLTVEELVAYGRHPYSSRFGGHSKEDLKKINWAMMVTGISDLAKRQIDSLSGGQKQRVWITLCLSQDTEIIFLDEPTTYLDIAHQLEILDILKNLKEDHGKTIVMVLHDLNQASKYADKIIALKDGRVIKEGNSREVISKRVLRELFSIEAEIIEDQKTKRPMCLSYSLK